MNIAITVKLHVSASFRKFIFQVFVLRNFHLGVPGPRTWALFLKVLRIVPMFGALGHQDKNFWGQKTWKIIFFFNTWILINIFNLYDPMTGESRRYLEVKRKINEFWVPRSCYLFSYHIQMGKRQKVHFFGGLARC